jgi:prevent-host-death family protein
MTDTISATEANQRFSALLRRVQQGEDFIVMSRGRAVARVVPYEPDPKPNDVTDLLDRLEKLPPKVLAHWSRDDLYS